MNKLFFGDNLDILREHIATESVDLIYLDPPFNSKRDYNLLFKSPKGHAADASITAFEDSWHWGEQAEREFSELLRQPNTDVAEMNNVNDIQLRTKVERQRREVLLAQGAGRRSKPWEHRPDIPDRSPERAVY